MIGWAVVAPETNAAFSVGPTGDTLPALQWRGGGGTGLWGAAKAAAVRRRSAGTGRTPSPHMGLGASDSNGPETGMWVREQAGPPQGVSLLCPYGSERRGRAPRPDNPMSWPLPSSRRSVPAFLASRPIQRRSASHLSGGRTERRKTSLCDPELASTCIATFRD